MFKRILSALLIAALVVGVSSAVASAVTGSFTINVFLEAKTTAREVTQFEVDLESLLEFRFTVSGLEFSQAAAFGVAGIEHVVLGLTANIGGLTLHDEFVFANAWERITINPEGRSITTFRPIGPLLFIKKRVLFEISIGGLTISNCAMFEDLNYNDPLTGSLLRFPFALMRSYTLPFGVCGPPRGLAVALPTMITLPWTVPATTFSGNLDSATIAACRRSYTAACQFFGFGNIFTVWGETPSGIRIALITGIDADPQILNCVKKRCFWGSVLPNVVAQTPGLIGAQKFGFEVEKILIDNIRIGPLTTGMELVFRPGAPLSALIYSTFAASIFSAYMEWSSTDLFAFSGYLSLTLSVAGIGSFIFVPLAATFSTDISLALDPAPATLRIRSTHSTATGALTRLRLDLRVDLGGGASLLSAADWGVTTPPTLRTLTFTLGGVVAGAVRLSASLTYNIAAPPPGIAGSTISITIPF